MTPTAFDISFQFDAAAVRCVSTVRLAARSNVMTRTRALASEDAG